MRLRLATVCWMYDGSSMAKFTVENTQRLSAGTLSPNAATLTAIVSNADWSLNTIEEYGACGVAEV